MVINKAIAPPATVPLIIVVIGGVFDEDKVDLANCGEILVVDGGSSNPCANAA